MPNTTNTNQQPICKIEANGTKCWFLNGQYHRVDGPAIEYVNGDKRWYLNGQYHRVDGPAVESVNGTKHWRLNGKLHRVDGPAVECVNGTKCWFLNGQYHRVDGPAIEYVNGTKCWYLNDVNCPPPTKYPSLPIGTLVTIDGKLGFIYDENTYIYHIYINGSQVVRFKWDENITNKKLYNKQQQKKEKIKK